MRKYDSTYYHKLQQNLLNFSMKNQLRFILSSYHSNSELKLNPIPNHQSFSPFQPSPKTNLPHLSHQITKRNSELKRMKERLDHLLKQTDQLCEKKKDLSQKIKNIGKSAEALNQGTKQEREEEIDSPIKKLYFSRSLTPKNQLKSNSFQFKLEPHHKTENKMKIKAIPDVDEKKNLQTQQDASLGTGQENLFFQNFSEKQIFNKNNEEKGKVEKEKSERVHIEVKERVQEKYWKSRSPEFQVILLQKQKEDLKKEVRELNDIREYYQKQLLEEMRKRSEQEKEYEKKMQILVQKYEMTITEFLTEIEKKEEKIQLLIKKGSINVNSIQDDEQLIERVVLLEKQNQYHLNQINQKNKQIEQLKQIIVENNYIRSQLSLSYQQGNLNVSAEGNPPTEHIERYKQRKDIILASLGEKNSQIENLQTKANYLSTNKAKFSQYNVSHQKPSSFPSFSKGHIQPNDQSQLLNIEQKEQKQKRKEKWKQKDDIFEEIN